MTALPRKFFGPLFAAGLSYFSPLPAAEISKTHAYRPSEIADVFPKAITNIWDQLGKKLTASIQPYIDAYDQPGPKTALDAMNSTAKTGLAVVSPYVAIMPHSLIVGGACSGITFVTGLVTPPQYEDDSFILRSFFLVPDTAESGWNCAQISSTLLTGVGGAVLDAAFDTLKLPFEYIGDPARILYLPKDLVNIGKKMTFSIGDNFGEVAKHEIPPVMSNVIYGFGNWSGEAFRDIIRGADKTKKPSPGGMLTLSAS